MIGPYLTSDERYLMLNMLQSDKYWTPCCRALELDGLATDESLATEAARAERAAELRQRFVDQIASQPLTRWVTRLANEGCVFSTMAIPTEVLEDPQVEANDYMPRHPSHSSARLVGSPAQFDEAPIEIRRRAPEYAEHSEEIMREAGCSDDETNAWRASGALT